jgi:iron(III) transport system permease protein
MLLDPTYDPFRRRLVAGLSVEISHKARCGPGALYGTDKMTNNRRRRGRQTPSPRIGGECGDRHVAAPVAQGERTEQFRVLAGRLWSGALLAVLAFLVLYPVAMLLLGALTNTNPVVDGFGVFDLSLANFVIVLGNPNVHHALWNTLVACTGGTALAVAIGLAFSWIVVRTNTPCKRFIGAASLIPLFVPPLVAGVAWSILRLAESASLQHMMKWAGLDWRLDVYSMTGLIVVFGMYYAPYVYCSPPGAAQHGPEPGGGGGDHRRQTRSPLFTVTFR